MRKAASVLFWILVAMAGAYAYLVLTVTRGEPVNSVYLLTAALCTYAVGYRFYSKWIAARVLMLNDHRATPCEVHDDGRDYVRTNKWIVFGHHFAAISGPGPLVGPVLAAQFGYLPGTLWILIGVVLGGAVQDFVILFCSLRRNGKSLGEMVKEELHTTAGYVASAGILAIMVILLAVLGLVVVKALAESPWGVFTVSATIPIAMFMGGYLRFVRVGKVLEASAIGIVLLLLAVWGGKLVHQDPVLAKALGLSELKLASAIIVYGFAASILPVWLLLAPRDYLSTFMKLGTIFALAAGIFLVLPDLQMPALSKFVDGSGPIVAGKMFPFCFITIACGAISGFHTLIASGTTPKILTRESYARPVGYGAMCLESLVAIMAMISACTLEPGVYLAMNMKGEPAAVVDQVNSYGLPLTVQDMDEVAHQIGEKTIFNRTGGAATLAVGMAHIFSRVVNGKWLDLWYHFAIMFEALFILTTIDAGTRVGRYLLHELLGHAWARLGDTRGLFGNLVASSLMVTAWGFFLIQGVRDPLGGINSLWPLFGIANQMLAAIALCLATTILLKMALVGRSSPSPEQPASGSRQILRPRHLSLALITLVPLSWLLSVTLSAGYQKISHRDPRIGFLSQALSLNQKLPALREAVEKAREEGTPEQLTQSQKALRANRVLHFNNQLDAVVAASFLALICIIVAFSMAEWMRLLSLRKSPLLHETAPVWLPEYAVDEARPNRLLEAAGLGLTLARELSGEAAIERARTASTLHACSHLNEVTAYEPITQQHAYLQVTEDKFRGVKRCC
jgi:carbon starvation protein